MRVVGFHRGSDIEVRNDTGNDGALGFHGAVQNFCSEEAHILVNFFGPKDQFLNTNDLTAQYEEMHTFFSSDDVRAALILIPNATHLADDVQTLVKRLIQIYGLECEVSCFSSDLPDPLQDGLAKLPLNVNGKNRSARITDTKRIIEKAAHGEVLGKTPYGYVANPQGKLVPDLNEAELVKKLFALYTEGIDERGPLGLRLIARHLNQQGFCTRQGRPWSQVTVSGILKNRVYLGTYSRYGVRIVGNHEPLIDREKFRAVDKIMHERSPVRGARASSPFLLSGIAVCATCTRNLVGVTRRRTWKREDGSHQSRCYRYYECPARSVTAERSGEKKHASWQADKLERVVVGEVYNFFAESGRKSIFIAKNDEQNFAAKLISDQKKFVRLLRDVADGYGRLEDLKDPLESLELLQSTSPVSQKSQPRKIFVEQLSSEIFNNDFVTARATLLALLESSIVSVRKVKIQLKTCTNHSTVPDT